MVLQEVNDSSPTTDDGFSSEYDGPSSTSPASQSSQTTVDLMSLPRPPPVFGYMLGYTNQFLEKRLEKSLNSAAQVIGRPLSQPEVDAVSYHMASMSRTAAWGDVLGIGGGYLRWRATRQELRFPKFLFFRGTAPANPEKLGPLTGAQARAGWNALRLLAYTSLGWALGGLFAGAYGAMTYTLKMSSDPRLSDLSEALRRRVNQRNNGFPEAQQAQRTMPIARPQEQKRYDDSDDMSPQSGSYTDTGLLSDRQMEARDRLQRPDPGQSPTSQRDNAFSMDKVTRQPSTFDQDDASPTTSYNTSVDATSSGSAWDRIRQQSTSGVSGGAPNRTFEQRSRSMGAQSPQDSFSFSSSDEEQQLARSEAQRDFDKRIERERQGKDFSDSSTARWGR